MRITEKKVVRIEHCVPKNPLYLCWKGVEGGWNYWLFSFRQTLGKQVSGQSFVKYNEDIESTLTMEAFLRKSTKPTVIVGAENLDENDVRGIQTILDSIEVKMLVNPSSWSTDGPVWQTVNVHTGTFKIMDTGNFRHSIEFSFDRVQKNIQTQ